MPQINALYGLLFSFYVLVSCQLNRFYECKHIVSYSGLGQLPPKKHKIMTPDQNPFRKILYILKQLQ